MVLVLLIPIIGFATANPFQDTPNDRSALQVQKVLLHHPTEGPSKADKMVENINKTLSNLKRATNRLRDSETRDNETNEKLITQGRARKHKALLDYSLVSRVPYPRVSPYEVGYNDDVSGIARKDRLSKEFRKRYEESNIFYVRLPPAPYTFVPGLGYISQPPAYSTATLKPQLPLVTQLLQLPYVRPVGGPEPAFQQTVNPFVKVPIDFVSNGKPTSVYQWQKKPNQRPADSPITNLDDLSADFVTNGKPTFIYRWPTSHKSTKRPDDSSLNSLDLKPYTFNGKLTSLYLLGPDGPTSMHQSIRYPDYQSAYY